MDNLSLRLIAEQRLHHSNNRFINPFNNAQYGNFWRLVRWKLLSKNPFKQLYRNEKKNPVDVDLQPLRETTGVSITFVKHSTVIINYFGKRIIVDPVFFGLFPFIVDFTPLTFNVSHIPQPHIILITHGHYDHLDIPSLKKLAPDTPVLSPLGYQGFLREIGFHNITSLDWYDSYSSSELEIILLPCNHWTMRNPFTGPNRALWGSFLLRGTADRPCIFISGDTAYFRGFREIGQQFHIDLAIINVGAYEPRWFMAQSHMNPQEAVRAFLELGANKLMVVHWGTFRLGDEPVYLPPIEVGKEMAAHGLSHRLINIRHGETYQLT